MKKTFAWIKKHPLTLVLIVGVAILLIVLFSGSKSSGGQVSYAGASGPSDAQVGAQAAVDTATIQAGAQAHGIDASLIAASNQQSFQLAEDQINANTAMYQTDIGAQVSIAGISAEQNVQLEGIRAGVQTADLNNKAALAQAGIYESIFTAQSRLQETQANDNAAVAINGQNAQVNMFDTQSNNQTAIALAPYTTVDRLISSGTLGQVTGTKDAFLNLPGFSAGRGTNYTPPGATPGQPNAVAAFLGGFAGGITRAFG